MAGVLSDLCSVCHLQPPKYRCPRCSTRTCSLPCSTRHKTRAECSGMRDPTVFIKKSQLETPSGFDHDYNFLTGLLDKVSRGDEHLENRDIEGQEGEPAPRRNAKFWDSVREIGLVVSKAPLGMSRQRANRSRWGNKYHGIIWSMEWIFEDGTKQLSEAKDSETLLDALQATKLMKAKRKSTTGKKRKQPPAGTDASSDLLSLGEETKEQPVTPGGDAPVAASGKVSLGETNMLFPSEATLEVPASISSLAEYSSSSSEEPTIGTDHGTEIVDDENKTQDVKELVEPSLDEEIPREFLYLVKPRVSGNQRVLIPLNPKMSIRENLRKKVILEFPTFQVLTASHRSLPDGFILEADYLVKFRKEQEELEMLAASAPELTQEIQQPHAHEQAISSKRIIPNAEDVMTILERDIGAG